MVKKKPRTPSTYPAHRERQRRRILDAARTLFDAHGIDRVTMAEITTASGVQASTLYQYFSSKDDIIWAITSEIMACGIQPLTRAIDAAPTALASITALFDRMANELSTQPENVRFMAQFDAMYARVWPAERLLTLESQINPDGFRSFAKLIREGIKDGSLRPDLDPKLTLHAVLNTVIGAQRRLASLDSKIEQEYGHPIGLLFRETIRVILLGLRAPESAAVTQPPQPPKPAKARKSVAQRKTT